MTVLSRCRYRLARRGELTQHVHPTDLAFGMILPESASPSYELNSVETLGVFFALFKGHYLTCEREAANKLHYREAGVEKTLGGGHLLAL